MPSRKHLACQCSYTPSPLSTHQAYQLGELCIGRHLCCMLRHVLVQVRDQVHAKAAQRCRHAAQQGGMLVLDAMLPPQDNLCKAAQRRKAVDGSHCAVGVQLCQRRQRSTAQLHTVGRIGKCSAQAPAAGAALALPS